MELMYSGPNRLRKELNEIAAGLFIIYAVVGSSYNSVKTGHQCADIVTGRSQPTPLEEAFTELVLGHK